VGKTLVEELQTVAMRRGVKACRAARTKTAQVLSFGLWVDALKREIVNPRRTEEVRRVSGARSWAGCSRDRHNRSRRRRPTIRHGCSSDHAVHRPLAEHGSLNRVLEDLHWATR